MGLKDVCTGSGVVSRGRRNLTYSIICLLLAGKLLHFCANARWLRMKNRGVVASNLE